MEFIWNQWNLYKIDSHALSADEVEHAWNNRQDVKKGNHPENGPYTESFGRCPSGRRIRIIWRYNIDRDGEQRIFVINAFGP